MSPNRREFLKMSAGAALSTGLANSIARALALPASTRNGNIMDVEHVVIFMQENRSFDHYFGHLRGVRGYNDRFPVRRANGKPVWHQPRKANAEEIVLPFHLPTQLSSAQCVLDLDHSWYPTHGAIAAGRNDQWPKYKTDMCMGYYLRDDIPFHYALADAFTLCDHYFCSVPSSTHPNRMYLMSGMVDPTGKGGGPLLNNSDEVALGPNTTPAAAAKLLPAFTYTSYPERLQKAGISWQVYQQGTGTDNYEGNYGCNMMPNFKTFDDAQPGDPLHDRGMSKRTIAQLRQDVMANKLPQVSWLIPPGAYSEHPKWAPGYGATYLAKIIDALTANPEVWSKTVLLINYDENDGYFDHVVPPQPPTPALPGKSTVSVEGEIHNVVHPRTTDRYHVDNLPYGLGPRVPMTVVSPWSKGGFVCSEVFDHTSTLRFLEKRFGVAEPNITQWRRTVCGDLTSAFDFKSPNATTVSLPDTSGYFDRIQEQCKVLPNPAVPAKSSAEDIMPQEPGTRPARPLPYDIAISDKLDGSNLSFTIENHGKVGASFYLYEEGTENTPRRYTIEAGKSIDDTVAVSGPYRLNLMGPNGFVRHIHGDAGTPAIAEAQHNSDGHLDLTLTNPTTKPVTLTLTDNAYGAAAKTITLKPNQKQDLKWETAKSANWYDVSITVKDDAHFLRRLAGHIEDGKASTSDPAMTKPVLEV